MADFLTGQQLVNNSVYFPTLADAKGNLTFLNPSLDVPSLLETSGFTNTLGCRLDEDYASCLQGCGNVTSIFSNWPNFYSCSWYPEISDDIENSNLTTDTIDLLETKGILGQQGDLISTASSSIANCLVDYCQSDQNCQSLDVNNACSLENLYPTNGASQVLNRTGAISCLRDAVCGSVDVNPDIGGLGVILSLLIQYTISLFGILIHGVINLYHAFLKKRAERISQPEKSTKLLEKAKKTQDRRLASLCSALVEFHKSQCFFSTTLQIAALIVLPKYLYLVRSKDQILLRLAAGNAFAPITLTLVHIELLSGRSSGYLLLLSCTSFMLGSTLYWQAWPHFLGPDTLTFIGFQNTPIPVMSCGNMAPSAPCFVGNMFYFREQWPAFQGVYYSLPQSIGLLVWIVSFLTLLYRVVLKVWNSAHSGERLMKHLRKWRGQGFENWHRFSSYLETFKLGGRVLGIGRRASEALRLTALRKRFWVIFTDLTVWDHAQLSIGSIALLLQLISVIQVLIFSSNMIATEMSFGQIVAVGIWVPVLLEYAYLEIKGPEEGTQYRLKAPLVVSTPPVASGAIGGASSPITGTPNP